MSLSEIYPTVSRLYVISRMNLPGYHFENGASSVDINKFRYVIFRFWLGTYGLGFDFGVIVYRSVI